MGGAEHHAGEGKNMLDDCDQGKDKDNIKGTIMALIANKGKAAGKGGKMIKGKAPAAEDPITGTQVDIYLADGSQDSTPDGSPGLSAGHRAK